MRRGGLGGSEFGHGPQATGVQQRCCVQMRVDRLKNSEFHRFRTRDESMAPHEDHAPGPETLRQCVAVGRIGDEKVGPIASLIPKIETTDPRSQERRDMHDRYERKISDRERNNRGRVAMHDRVDIWPRRVNLTMDEPFEIDGSVVIDDLARRVVPLNVRRLDERWGTIARHEESLAARVSNTDVTECIENAVSDEDTVGFAERFARAVVHGAGQCAVSGWRRIRTRICRCTCRSTCGLAEPP